LNSAESPSEPGPEAAVRVARGIPTASAAPPDRRRAAAGAAPHHRVRVSGLFPAGRDPRPAATGPESRARARRLPRDESGARGCARARTGAASAPESRRSGAGRSRRRRPAAARGALRRPRRALRSRGGGPHRAALSAAFRRPVIYGGRAGPISARRPRRPRRRGGRLVTTGGCDR
jgi:hypothetical protein